jgi:hypothetical protein
VGENGEGRDCRDYNREHTSVFLPKPCLLVYLNVIDRAVSVSCRIRSRSSRMTEGSAVLFAAKTEVNACRK